MGPKRDDRPTPGGQVLTVPEDLGVSRMIGLNAGPLLHRWEFTITGTPMPQGRPRFSVRGYAYDPERSRRWKRDIGLQVLMIRPHDPSSRPMRLSASFTMPSSTRTADDWHVGKPDISNLLKALEDALEGIFYVNDAQLVEVIGQKRYGSPGGMTVIMEELA